VVAPAPIRGTSIPSNCDGAMSCSVDDDAPRVVYELIDDGISLRSVLEVMMRREEPHLRPEPGLRCWAERDGPRA